MREVYSGAGAAAAAAAARVGGDEASDSSESETEPELCVTSIKRRVSAEGRVVVGAVELVRALTGGTESAARKHLQRLMARYDLGVEHEASGRGGKARLVCNASSAASVVLASPCAASMAERMRFAAELSDSMGDSGVMRAAEEILATIPRAARDFLGHRATPADLLALAPVAALVEETAERFEDVRGALRGLWDAHAACEHRARMEIEGLEMRVCALETTLRALVEVDQP